MQKRSRVHKVLCHKEIKVEATGGCYCGELGDIVSGAVKVSLQCHCRKCQYITGGNLNVAAIFALEDFKCTEVSPATFARSYLKTHVYNIFAQIVEKVLEVAVQHGQTQ